MTADELTENRSSPVLLKNTAGFVKFGNRGTLISNLTKSPLVISCHRQPARALARDPPRRNLRVSAPPWLFFFTLKLRNEHSAGHGNSDDEQRSFAVRRGLALNFAAAVFNRRSGQGKADPGSAGTL